jgi:lipopolysaccharide/colanic/teichoic acid biosynthesis glycosyltransferase
MIPKRIFWLLDILAMLAAAWLAGTLLRSLEPLFNERGLLHSHWLQFLHPARKVYWDYASSPAYLWLILGPIPLVLAWLDLTGNYGPLFKQSRARIVFGCLVAPLASLSMAALVLFVFKAPPLSRFALLIYPLTSSFTLCAYRLSLCAHCRSRAKRGAYTTAVLLVGYKKAVDRVALIFADPGLRTLYRPVGYIGDAGNNGSSDPESIESSFGVAKELKNRPAGATGPAGHPGLERIPAGRLSSCGVVELLQPAGVPQTAGRGQFVVALPPSTPGTQPSTLNPQPSAPQSVDRGLWTVDSTPSTLDPRPSPLDTPPSPLALPRLGGFGDLRHLLNNCPINKVVMVLPSAQTDWAGDVIDACDELGVTLRVVPQSLLFHSSTGLRASRLPDSLPLPGVLLVPRNYKPEALFLKRCLDALAAGLLLVLLTPLLALVALLIKGSAPRSPVLFKFRAIGKNGASFFAYKFRTMIPGAEKLKDQLLGRNEMNGPVFKMKNDPRITPLGRFLRKYSIDELPQLWNVLQGDLSLVGPRPPWPQEVHRYAFWQKRRLSVKPGLTCLWQVRGRNKVSDFSDWVMMDLEYIDKWSLWLDFKILLWTIPAVIKGTGC